MPENNDVRLENIVAVMFSDYLTADDYEKLQLGQMYARIASGDVEKNDFDNNRVQEWNNLYKNVTSKRGQDTKTEKGQAYDARCKIFDMFDFVTKNPDDTKSKNFMKVLENVMFANRIINGRIIAKQVQDFSQMTSNEDYEYYEDVAKNAMLLLGKISAFQDEKLKYNCCKYLHKNMVPYGFQPKKKSAGYGDVQERAVTICANSPLATVSDLFALQQWDPTNRERTKRIFADMEPMARKELDAELKSEASDIHKITSICAQVDICARYTGDAAIIAQVRDAYNVNKILMGNPVEYVSKMPNPYADKAAELEGQIETIQQQAQQQIATLQQQITNLQNRNQTLNNENSALRQQNTAIAQQNDGAKKKLLELKSGIEKLGMLGAGQNDLKKRASEMEI